MICAMGSNSTKEVELANDSDFAVDGNVTDDSNLAKAIVLATKGNFAGDGIFVFTADGNFANGEQLCQGGQLCHEEKAFAKDGIFAEEGNLR
jgi:hypothetical protein